MDNVFGFPQTTAPDAAPLAYDQGAAKQMTTLNPQEAQHNFMHQRLMAALLMNRPQPTGGNPMQGLSQLANGYVKGMMITNGGSNG